VNSNNQQYPAIYTDEHLFQCNQALQNCAIVRELIAKQKRIGLDMSALENDNEHQHATLMRWKQEWFPHSP
jgi:hypothetical protein